MLEEDTENYYCACTWGRKGGGGGGGDGPKRGCHNLTSSRLIYYRGLRYSYKNAQFVASL